MCASVRALYDVCLRVRALADVRASVLALAGVCEHGHARAGDRLRVSAGACTHGQDTRKRGIGIACVCVRLLAGV